MSDNMGGGYVTCLGENEMSKGSKRRPGDNEAYRRHYDLIFRSNKDGKKENDQKGSKANRPGNS